MKRSDLEDIATWLSETGLKGGRETDLLNGFCAKAQAAGIPISRGIVIIDTLHPIYTGRAFRWRDDGIAEEGVIEFERTEEPDPNGAWSRSPFNYLLTRGGGELRFRLEHGETGGFPAAEELLAEGQTDYFVAVHVFQADAVVGDMDNIATRWSSAKPGGFSDAEVEALRRLTPILGLAIKAASLARVSQTLMEAYLGRDAGRRVLKGRIRRGAVEKIGAVLWYSDLKGFTGLSESMQSDQLIPFLNDHADVVISAIEAAGGDVLKLIGDGVLAIFNMEAREAGLAAIRAEHDMRRRLGSLHQQRMAEGAPIANVYLGLHVGDVFYGNIGSRGRLDFTVVGQAVNETSRIATMCSSADRGTLVSSAFRNLLPPEEQANLISVGRYALRGVGRAQELFTCDLAH